ncbi:MAG: family 10 glycosylhydrolase [Melioribacteraceae bacterium]
MKNIVLFFFIVFIVSIYSQPNNSNSEFRATWVITWEHISSGSSVEQNKARVREILDNHKKANMTSVLFQVRQGGSAYYNSSYEPWGTYAGSSNPGYDPLDYAIDEAHKRGLELHAWFNVFNVSSTLPGTISDKHPEWICRDQNGNPMTAYRAASPGLAEVRDYTVNVAMEIVRNYDIDGLHLDYIRWNEFNTDDMILPADPTEQVAMLDGDFPVEKLNKLASTNSSNRFLYDVEHPFSSGVPSGYGSWEDWWRWSVTEFVKTLHDSIQTVKPWVRLSPAALGKYKAGGVGSWNGYYVVYQDAALWFNEGYVDQLTPMHYHWLTGNDMYDAIVSDWKPNIQKGISDGRLFSVGPPSYRLADNNRWSNHVDIVNKLRTENWIDGFQFFSYGSWYGYDYWNTASSLFFTNKVKVRSSNLSNKPITPNLELLKIDSLTYKITITPDGSDNDKQWYLVYRSEDESFDATSDVIIDIHFGNESYVIEQNFSGTQNFNGTYFYFATSLNRYWNESAISNSGQTDLLPSFAPAIATTNPVENEEVDITKVIKISFTKSMNTETFLNLISIVPEIQINSVLWEDDNKKLSIDFENFTFQTTYTLTIDSTAMDINGVSLDGNNDGIKGDSFILNFSTSEFDIFPPKILFTNPNSIEQGLDIASIITIVFDEKIEEQTIIGSGISLSKGSEAIDFSYLLEETVDGKSVINIQPNTLFDVSTNYTLILSKNISDTLGNNLDEDFSITFTTFSSTYDEVKMIEDFSTPGDWWQPSGSGSTVGIFESGTSFGYTKQIVLPAPSIKRAGKLSYLWKENADGFLLREYLSGGVPQAIYFDTSYVLQSYVYGDGSNNLFRFCIDENDGSNWTDHEVSKWIVINWQGWKLVEWQLSDPNSIGTWISSNEELTGTKFRIDSYQLSKSEGGSLSGEIYFDELRAVRKNYIPTGLDENAQNIPTEFVLSQNYPNPFNPTTTIQYSIPVANFGSSTNIVLKVYDVLGQEVATLINQQQKPGNYKINFDAKNLTSGIYYYSINTGSFVQTKKMIIIK